MNKSKLLSLLLLTGANTLFINEVAKAEVKNLHVREKINLIAQNSPSEQSVINQVTGVNIKEVNSKLEVIIETANPGKLEVINRSLGNDFIAEITNAQINLSDGERFFQQQPINGIAEVIVTNKDEKQF